MGNNNCSSHNFTYKDLINYVNNKGIVRQSKIIEKFAKNCNGEVSYLYFTLEECLAKNLLYRLYSRGNLGEKINSQNIYYGAYNYGRKSRGN